MIYLECAVCPGGSAITIMHGHHWLAIPRRQIIGWFSTSLAIMIIMVIIIMNILLWLFGNLRVLFCYIQREIWCYFLRGICLGERGLEPPQGKEGVPVPGGDSEFWILRLIPPSSYRDWNKDKSLMEIKFNSMDIFLI